LIDRRTFLLTPLALTRAADRAPNLVLIAPSGWRGQATPWDHDPDLSTPNLEKFGKQSVVFSRTYCACPKPDLAQAALLTAKFPHAAKQGDEVLGHLKTLTPDAAIKAFEKTPFAVQIAFPDPQDIREPSVARLHVRGNVSSSDELSARQELAKFYGRCAAIDDDLGRIFDALDRLSLSQNTLVAFTSDCGRQMWSQGLDGNEVPFEESVRIPLAIRYPGKLKPDARDLASQVDIMPTLLTLCGMEIPDGVQGQNLFGTTPPEVAFAEFKGDWRMLVRGYDKVIATPKGEITHLFNLADDAYEMTNLDRDPAQKLQLASLKAQLLAQMQKLADGMDPSGLRIR
jgi:arylsulfatase A-like enzyme